MAFRALRAKGVVVTTTATLLAAGIILYPKAIVFAEAPDGSHSLKKPIYDDTTTVPPPSSSRSSSSLPSSSEGRPTPTPTDRLAVQIRRTRLFVYNQALAAEDRINGLMNSFLHMESNFTSTIASLVPPKESGERLMPGAIYVLITAMTGSIVSRNRNILLRASLPVAVGIGAGWAVLPVTMRNVGDLLWTYEKRFPVVSDTHLQIRRAAEEGWRQTKIHGKEVTTMVDQKAKEGRVAVEGWISKGK